MRNNDNRQNKEFKMQYTYSFKVNKSDTLLEFLLRKIPNSRNTIKGLLSKNMVLVNGTPIRRFDYPLCKDDDVKISKYSINTPNQALKSKLKDDKKIDISKFIIYEDENYIAFNKPSGLLSVESDNDNESLYKYVSEFLNKKDKKSRPFILHRIDKDTSGVILFTKKIEIHSKLKMHWDEDVKLREYYALVDGKLDNKNGQIKSYLKENVNHIVYSTKDPKGKLSITNYEVIKESDKYSLLKVTIDTGRKNQIRVHMKDISHPVVGDTKYSNGLGPINRLGLHASRFIFYDPISKKDVEIKAPIPVEFNKVFKNE